MHIIRVIAALVASTLATAALAAGPHPWPPMPAVQPEFVQAPAYQPDSDGLQVRWLDESNAGAYTLIALDEPQEVGPTVPRSEGGQVIIELPAGWAGRPLLAMRVWYDERGEAAWWDTRLVTRPQIYLPVVGVQ